MKIKITFYFTSTFPLSCVLNDMCYITLREGLCIIVLYLFSFQKNGELLILDVRRIAWEYNNGGVAKKWIGHDWKI